MKKNLHRRLHTIDIPLMSQFHWVMYRIIWIIMKSSTNPIGSLTMYSILKMWYNSDKYIQAWISFWWYYWHSDMESCPFLVFHAFMIMEISKNLLSTSDNCIWLLSSSFRIYTLYYLNFTLLHFRHWVKWETLIAPLQIRPSILIFSNTIKNHELRY